MSTSNFKRTALITFIIAVVSLVITAIIGFASGSLWSIASGEFFLPVSDGNYAYRLHGVEYGNASIISVEEKKSVSMADMRLISVKTQSESIRIHEGSGKFAILWLHGTSTIKNGDYRPHLVVRQHNGVIKILIETKVLPRFITSSANKTVLDISLPKGYLKNLSAESISGSIDLGSHDYDSVMLKTTSGSINIENMNASEFSSETISGSLYAKALLTRRAEISSTSGQINVGAFTGDINVHSVSGIVGITYITVPGNCTAETTSGNIVLNLPQFAKFQLDASSTSGDVMSDFPITTENPHSDSGNHSIVGTVSNGKSQIRLHSISGGIAVNRCE